MTQHERSTFLQAIYSASRTCKARLVGIGSKQSGEKGSNTIFFCMIDTGRAQTRNRMVTTTVLVEMAAPTGEASGHAQTGVTIVLS